jgi:hypothetical protein
MLISEFAKKKKKGVQTCLGYQLEVWRSMVVGIFFDPTCQVASHFCQGLKKKRKEKREKRKEKREKRKERKRRRSGMKSFYSNLFYH